MDRVQRQILGNQFEILKHLDPDPAKHYELHQETLYGGYTEYHSTVLECVAEKDADADVQEETIDILNMFRALSNAMQRGWKPKNPDNAVCQGFDGNHDDHYSFAVYLLDKRNLFVESQSCPRNSHSSFTLQQYRRMVRDWKNCADQWKLTDAEADLIST